MEVRKCPVLAAGSAIIRRRTIWTSIGEFVPEHDLRETPGSTASSLSVFSAREFTVARSAVHERPKRAMFFIFEVLLQRRKRVFVRGVGGHSKHGVTSLALDYRKRPG
jgi:hypothetical protein